MVGLNQSGNKGKFPVSIEYYMGINVHCWQDLNVLKQGGIT